MQYPPPPPVPSDVDPATLGYANFGRRDTQGQRLSLVGFRVAVHPHSYTDRRPFGPALERLLYIR